MSALLMVNVFKKAYRLLYFTAIKMVLCEPNSLDVTTTTGLEFTRPV